MTTQLSAFLLVALAAGSVHATGKAADPVREYRKTVAEFPAAAKARNAKKQPVATVRSNAGYLSSGTCRGWLCTAATKPSQQAVLNADYDQQIANATATEQRGLDAEHARAMEDHTAALATHEGALGKHAQRVASYERDLAAHGQQATAHREGTAALAQWERDVKAYDAKIEGAKTARWPGKRSAQALAMQAKLGPRPVKPTVPAAPGAAPTHPGEAPIAPKAPVRRTAQPTAAQQREARLRQQNIQQQFWEYERYASAIDHAMGEMGLPDRIGSLFGREESAGKAIDQAVRAADAYDRTLDHERPERDVREAEARLQRTITAKLRRDRAQLKTRLKSAPTPELYEEALELMEQAQDLTSHTKIRAEVTGTASGESSSEHHGSRSERAAGRAGGGWASMAEESSGGSSRSSWRSEKRQLLLDAEVLSMSVRPGVAMEYPRAGELTLPEARIVVEKVLRAQQLYRALVKRDPERAANIQRWMQHSQITINYQGAGGYRDQGSHTLQVRRLGPDLKKMVSIGLIDADRAAELEDDARDKLADF